MSSIAVNICENNERGNPSGFVKAIDFGDDICFETTDQWIGERFWCHKTKISTLFGIQREKGMFFGKEKFKYQQQKYWAGNMMWNMYYMELSEYLRLLNYIMKNRNWSIQSAPTKIIEAQKEGKDITAENWELILQ